MSASLRARFAYRIRVVQARVGARLAQSAMRRRKSPLDRVLARLLERLVAGKRDPADDFMRDEIVDAAIGFEPEELARYQRGRG